MSSEHFSRLRWSCRRGMLELDVLLGNFLENEYLKLSIADQKTFEQLLECSDQNLYEWFMEKNSSNDPNLQQMIEKIRQHARNKR